MKGKIMPILVILAFCVQTAGAEIALEYQEKTLMMPETSQTLFITARNFGNHSQLLNVSCWSGLLTICPDKINVSGTGAKEIPISVNTTDIGTHNITFIVGSEAGIIEVKVSNAPKILFNILEYYNESMHNLTEQASGLDIKELEEVQLALAEARELYIRGYYYQVNEKIGEIQEIMATVSEMIPEMEMRKDMELLREEMETFVFPPIAFIPISLLIFLFGMRFTIQSRGRVRVDFKKDIHRIKDINIKRNNLNRKKPEETHKHHYAEKKK